MSVDQEGTTSGYILEEEMAGFVLCLGNAGKKEESRLPIGYWLDQ